MPTFNQLESIAQAPFLNYNFLGNPIKTYLIALIAFFALLVVFRFFQATILHRLKGLAKRTKTDIDDTFIKIVETIRPSFYSFLAFYLALNVIVIKSFVQKIINAILIVWVVYQAIIVIQVLINYIVRKSLYKNEENGAKAAMATIGKISKFILWVLGILLILSNLGVNITSLVAGLGIGGVAVALALQNILTDLFSSFAIYFDKPFVVGDFIVVGDHMGVVEKVGIKTTRIRALQGEEVVISNKELTSTRIQNFKKMQKRRVVFSFGVVYETSMEKMKRIPAIIKNIIAPIELAELNRAHFKSFDDSALTFEVVYYVLSGDYNQYMDINQEIHFKIKEVFEKEEISMAYPTRTVYLNR